MTDMPVPSVRPYKGRHSFADTHDDRLLFFGRENEARMLLDVVAAERLSVLYARSGLGKTSLINARLMKGLRDSGYFPAVVRLTQDRDGDPLSSLYLGIESEAQRQEVEITTGNRDSLWQYFSETHFTNKEGKTLRPVLILDQFEELFTLVREKSGERFERFVGQLADLVRGRMPPEIRDAALKRLETMAEGDPEREALAGRIYGDATPDIKVLLSFREDYLPEMEALQDRMPGIFRNVVRMRPLSRKNAEAAITQPGQAKEVLGEDNTFAFEAAAIKELLDFLSTQLKDKHAAAGEEIEPVHLQLLCDELDRRRKTKKKGDPRLITVADLGGARGMRRILEHYYQSVLKRFPRIRLGWSARRWRPSANNLLAVHFPRRAIRKLSQNGLITSNGRRNIIMADEAERHYGIDDAMLASLVNERLLRCEPRRGSHFYELAHDSLIAPLLSARRRQRIRSAAVVIFFIAMPYLAISAVAIHGQYVIDQQLKRKAQNDESRRNDLATLSRNGAGAKERDEAFARLVGVSQKDLAMLDRKVVLTRLTYVQPNLKDQPFRGIKFEGGQTGQVDFSRSDLTGARFDRTSFYMATFIKADLSGASLAAAQLKNANFNEAKLIGANFRNADLGNAIFVDADLKGALLAEAELSNARMHGARNVDSADFTATEWWLAIGWTPDQIRVLEERWPHRSIADTTRYQDTIKNLQWMASKATPIVDRANQLNALAWYRAIRGTDLESALKEASEAISILNRLNDRPSLDCALDTLAYIQLQLGQTRDALDSFQKVRWDKTLTSPEMYYRFGIALSRMEKYSEARKYLEWATQEKYEPTHELLLAPVKTKP